MKIMIYWSEEDSQAMSRETLGKKVRRNRSSILLTLKCHLCHPCGRSHEQAGPRCTDGSHKKKTIFNTVPNPQLKQNDTGYILWQEKPKTSLLNMSLGFLLYFVCRTSNEDILFPSCLVLLHLKYLHYQGPLSRMVSGQPVWLHSNRFRV